MLKECNRFSEIRRTTGVSTTDLTGKLLNLIDPAMSEESKSDTSPTIGHVEPPK